MDRYTIIGWAIKAHMEASDADDDCRLPHFEDVTLEELEAFAALVRADEREALLDIVYSYADSLSWNDEFQEAITAKRNT